MKDGAIHATANLQVEVMTAIKKRARLRALGLFVSGRIDIVTT
jgi:hypothetical protein